MTAPLILEMTSGSHEIALELHTILRENDPARRREYSRAAVADRLSALAVRVAALLEATRNARDERIAELHAKMAEMRVALECHAERWRQGEGRKQLHRSLQQYYEKLAAVLREYRIHVPSLRPTNYTRNIFHVSMGLFTLVLLFTLSSAGRMWLAVAFAAYAWTMEIVRRISPAFNERIMRMYGRVAHPHEWHRINSATWYATAILVLATTASPLGCAVSVAILSFADPAAAIIGRRFGRIRLVHGRSLEGSTAFAVVGTIAGTLAALVGGAPLMDALPVAAMAALLAALAELFSHRLDDNLTVPLAGMAGVHLAGLILGLGL